MFNPSSMLRKSSLSSMRQASQQPSRQSQQMPGRTQQTSKQTKQKPPNQWTTHRSNYIITNRFYVEIGNEIKASFSECSGFGVNIKKETLLEGGLNDQQHILVGHAEFDDVTLKRGMTSDLTFWDWLSSTLIAFPKTRHNLNILMFNQAGETELAWSLLEAIPVSWKAPALQADSSSVAIEELTLAYEGIELVLPNRTRPKSIDLQSVTNNIQSQRSNTTQSNMGVQKSNINNPEIQAIQAQMTAIQAQMNAAPSFMKPAFQAQISALEAKMRSLL